MGVTFYEEGHKYLTEAGTSYTSVTTVIGKYKEPFDGDFWSLYKAIEKVIIESAGEAWWRDFKRSVGYANVNDEFFKVAKDESKAKAYEYQREVLKEWEYEKDIACFNGSNFHLAKENKWLEEPRHFTGVRKKVWYNTGVQNMAGKNISPEELPDGIYSELVLWDNYHEIAGQADIVYIQTVDGVRYVDIDDYKTNKKIDEKSYFDRRRKKHKGLQHPLTGIMDCHYGHYELQISTYAYMMERFGFTARYLQFQHWNNVGTKEKPRYEFNREFELRYRRDEVKAMFKDFKSKKR